ncbi:MAG: serine hydrolase domain-containing protein [Myxococcota bacterium]
MLWWLFAACAPPPCPGFPGDIPISHGIRPASSDVDWDALDAFIVDEMEQGCVPALSLALSTPEGVQWSAAYGWADLEAGIPATPQTPFMLASASKMIVGLSLVIAQQQGHLSLNDPIDDHLRADIRNPRLADRQPRIRVEHLATHTAGIRDNWTILDETYVDGDSPLQLGAFLLGYLREGGEWYDARQNFFRWSPGDVWMYSNVGAALAAHIVEEATAQSYPTYTDEILFSPLGMTQTRWFFDDYDDPTVLARPYRFDEDGQWEPIAHYGFATYPDGQLRSTAEEMGRVLSMVTADGQWDGQRVAEPDAIAAMLTTTPALSKWYVRDYMSEQKVFWFGMLLGEREIIGHDGDDSGVSTEVFYDADSKVGVAVLMNLADGERGGQPRAATEAIQQRLYAIGASL